MLDKQTRTRQLREKISQSDQRERQQFIAVLALFVVVSIIIGALFLVQATTNVGTARDIQQLREKRSRIERQNEALRAENAELNSIPRLIERANALGFVTAAPKDIQYLTVEGYVYNQPAPTSTPVLITPTPQIYEDNFAGWLQRQLDWIQGQFDSWGEE